MTRQSRGFAVAALAVAFLAAAVAPSLADPASPLSVADAWSRPAAAAGAGVVYLTLVNRGPGDDALVSAASPLAARVVLHQTTNVGGVSSMRAIASLAIPAGRTVTLAPGGAHLMLEGLKHALRPGDRVPLTLTFSHAGARRVTSTVRVAPGETMPGMGM
jgi:copper(I)-binding protein